MSASDFGKNTYRGLKIFVKILEFLAIAIIVVPFFLFLIEGIINGRLLTSVIFSAFLVGLQGALVGLGLYIVSQLIGDALSRHDNLKAIREGHEENNQELKRTNGLLNLQYRRLTALQEQQEQQRNP